MDASMLTQMKNNRTIAFGTVPKQLTSPVITYYHAGKNDKYGQSTIQKRKQLFDCCQSEPTSKLPKMN